MNRLRRHKQKRRAAWRKRNKYLCGCGDGTDRSNGVCWICAAEQP